MWSTAVGDWISVQMRVVLGGVRRINMQGGIDLIIRYHALRVES